MSARSISLFTLSAAAFVVSLAVGAGVMQEVVQMRFWPQIAAFPANALENALGLWDVILVAIAMLAAPSAVRFLSLLALPRLAPYRWLRSRLKGKQSEGAFDDRVGFHLFGLCFILLIVFVGLDPPFIPYLKRLLALLVAGGISYRFAPIFPSVRTPVGLVTNGFFCGMVWGSGLAWLAL